MVVNAGLSGEEFVGYTFAGSPERRPRLWFLDRQLDTLFHWGPLHTARTQALGIGQVDLDIGIWTMECRHDRLGSLFVPDDLVRYAHHGPQKWTAVWRLTDTVIPGVHTFGYDDVWRLGVWPD